MDVAATAPALATPPRPVPAERARGGHGSWAGRVVFWAAAGWIGLVVFAAVFADVLPLPGPSVPVVALSPRTPPLTQLAEPLGTDAFGRSVLSRMAFGARQSLLIGAGSVVSSLLVGLVLGILGGYLRRAVDPIVRVVLDALLSVPPLVLLLAIAAVGRRSVPALVLGLALVGVPTYARLARARTIALASRDYVLAARVMGAGPLRVLGRELLPGVLAGLVTYVFLHLGLVVVAEGSLSFLGLGVPPPTPSWGGMVDEGRRHLTTAPYLIAVPAAALVLTVLAFTILAEHARRLLELGREVDR